MWNEIYQILEQKAKQGVDVRLLYDGMGSQHLLPMRYDKNWKKPGSDVMYSIPSDPCFLQYRITAITERSVL